jgi:hypothetical protein
MLPQRLTMVLEYPAYRGLVDDINPIGEHSFKVVGQMAKSPWDRQVYFKSMRRVPMEEGSELQWKRYPRTIAKQMLGQWFRFDENK